MEPRVTWNPPPPTPSLAGLNLNTATLKELESLPGVDRRLAENILWYRENVGPFLGPRDMLFVPGMTEDRYLDLINRGVDVR